MSTRLMRHTNKKHTITSWEIWTAVYLLLPGELSKLAVSEGTKYTSSITNIHCCFFFTFLFKTGISQSHQLYKRLSQLHLCKMICQVKISYKTCVYPHLMYNNGITTMAYMSLYYQHNMQECMCKEIHFYNGHT